VKLNKAELEWITKVQGILDECPSKRLGFYTIGDSEVSIYDLRKEEKIGDILDEGRHDFCGAVIEVGADTETYLTFPANVHSTSG
jgi:hypothetical protein